MKAILSKRALSAACIVMLSAGVMGCMNTNDDGVRQQGAPTANRYNNMQAQRQDTANRNNGVQDEVQIAEKAANQIVKLSGVRQANVLVTRRNAYVAAILDERQGQLSRNTEDQIAAKVRQVDPNVQNVYVSTNPEFVDRVNAYVEDVRQGRPVAGFVDQLNEMIQRIFPNAR